MIASFLLEPFVVFVPVYIAEVQARQTSRKVLKTAADPARKSVNTRVWHMVRDSAAATLKFEFTVLGNKHEMHESYKFTVI